MEPYKQKYLKYKNKYLELKGGAPSGSFIAAEQRRVASLRSILINNDDINDCFTPAPAGQNVLNTINNQNNAIGRVNNIYKLDNAGVRNRVNTKLNNAVPILIRRAGHVIQTNEFNTLYFSSDTHGDYRKFVQMLKSVGLISGIDHIDLINDIYNLDIITNVEWNGGAKVLFVLVGDIVDGRRVNGNPHLRTEYIHGQVNDPNGSFEFLLLLFLYNLRIKARIKKSEILYTIGNHDYLTVIKSYPGLPDLFGYIRRYTTDESKPFFNVNRTNALLPFYKLNPYFMLSIRQPNGTKEIACVHGAFHTQTGTSKTRHFEEFQDYVDANFNGIATRTLFNEYDTFRDYNLGLSSGNKGPLYSTIYAERNNSVANTNNCGVLRDDVDYKLNIVGHCPSTQYDRQLDIINTNPVKYPGCSKSDGIFAEIGELDPATGTNFKYINPDVYDIVNTLNDTFKVFDPANKRAYNLSANETVVEKGFGCVVTDCDNPAEGNAPRVVLVDTSLSNAFRTRKLKDNKTRNAQFLRLTHDSSAGALATRYFNVMESVTAGTDLPLPVTRLYPFVAPPAVVVAGNP